MGIQPSGQEGRRDFPCLISQFSRVLPDGNGMEIDNAINTFMRVLQTDKVFQCAQIIAQM